MNTIDQNIIESIRHGNDSLAICHLYGKPFKKIKAYILRNKGTREDAQDIFQDCLLILFNQVLKNKYDERYSIEAFLFSVSRNLWINKVKRSRKILNDDELLFDKDHIDTDDVLNEIISKEKLNALGDLLEKMNTKCRMIFHYAVYEELSMQEISQKMGFASANAAKTTHYRCKKCLEKMVKENERIFHLLSTMS